MNIGTLWALIGLDNTELKKGADDTERRMSLLDSNIGSSAENIKMAIAGAGAAFATWKLGDLIQDSAMFAANVEMSNRALVVVGNQMGYNADASARYRDQIRNMNITTQAATGAVAQFIRAQLPLEKLPMLTKIAQGAAIMSSLSGQTISSSEALEKMTRSVITGYTAELHQLGIMVNRRDLMREFVEQTGQSSKAFDSHTMHTQLLNDVLEKGNNLVTLYGESQDLAAKKIQSSKRPIEELKLALGELFLPELNAGATSFYTTVDHAMKVVRDPANAQAITNIKDDIWIFSQAVWNGAKAAGVFVLAYKVIPASLVAVPAAIGAVSTAITTLNANLVWGAASWVDYNTLMIGEGGVVTATSYAATGVYTLSGAVRFLGLSIAALYTGYQIGKWAYDNFQLVREISVFVSAGVQKLFFNVVDGMKMVVAVFMASYDAIKQRSLTPLVNAFNKTNAERKQNQADIDAGAAIAFQEVANQKDGAPVKAPYRGQVQPTPTIPGHTGDDGKSIAGSENSARVAYKQYLKVFYETQAQMQKDANDLAIQQDQIAYNWGLKDLQSYLNDKHKLAENSLTVELEAKKKELEDARKVETEAIAAYDKDPSGGAAAAVNKAYAGTQAAIKAVNDAQHKLTQQQVADADETKKGIYDQLRGYQEIQAQLLDQQGQYVQAAQLRKKSAEDDQKYWQLVADAMAGVKGAEEAFWATEAMNQQKVYDAEKKRATEQANIILSQIQQQEALLNVQEKYYKISHEEASSQRITLLQRELTLHQQIYDSIKGNEPSAVTARQQELGTIQEINNKLLEQKKLISDRTALGGATNAFNEYKDAALNWGAQVQNAVSSTFKGMEDSLVNFVTKGKTDFKSLADSIIADLVRIAIQQSVTGPLSSALGGFMQSMWGGSSTASGITGGGGVSAPTIAVAASGYDIPAGVNPMVQAHEQEMILPREHANVIRGLAKSGTGGGAPNVQVNLINQSGNDVKAEQQGRASFDGEQWVINVVLKKMKSDPSFRNAMASGGSY